MDTSESTDLHPSLAIINGTIKTTSLKIAEHFGKRHTNVLRAIKSLECSPEYHQLNFELMVTKVEIGSGATRQDPYYEITKDGFAFLAMGFTGKEAARWKEAYITAFNKMEEQLYQKTLPAPMASINLVMGDPRAPSQRYLIDQRAGMVLITPFDHNDEKKLITGMFPDKVLVDKKLLETLLGAAEQINHK